jgi:hypothetical protein
MKELLAGQIEPREGAMIPPLFGRYNGLDNEEEAI